MKKIRKTRLSLIETLIFQLLEEKNHKDLFLYWMFDI